MLMVDFPERTAPRAMGGSSSVPMPPVIDEQMDSDVDNTTNVPSLWKIPPTGLLNTTGHGNEFIHNDDLPMEAFRSVTPPKIEDIETIHANRPTLIDAMSEPIFGERGSFSFLDNLTPPPLLTTTITPPRNTKNGMPRVRSMGDRGKSPSLELQIAMGIEVAVPSHIRHNSIDDVNIVRFVYQLTTPLPLEKKKRKGQLIVGVVLLWGGTIGLIK